MYCPKCGTENPDGTIICRNCGCALTGISPTPATVLRQQDAGAKTSALAITSLVLGLLSFCTFFLTAPLAVILGIVALIMIAKSHGQLKGMGMAIAGIAVPIVMLPLLGILMAILMPALMKVRCVALQQACSARLKQVGITLQMYANDNDRQYPTPDKWCDLLKPYYGDANVLICPSSRQEQRYYAINPQAEPNSPSDVVLLFETKGGWNQSGGPELLATDNHIKFEKGCNILFADGHVEFIRAEDINNLRWTAEQ
jgi:prepilin-type processing-associated H-X9-DG protein